jgi:streptogramin lyase
VRLPVSEDQAPVRAAQPSDISVGPDGTLYLADFEKRKIVISPDGKQARAVSGATGSGAQLPHMAVYKKLLLVADPTSARVVMYDLQGKQRGAYVFPPRIDGTHPVGIAVTPDGHVYLADITGYVHRLLIVIPPDLAE